MKKTFLILMVALLSAILVLTVTGCSKKRTEEVIADLPTEPPEPTAIPTPSPSPSPSPLPTEDITGKAMSPLTGLYIDEEVARRRPVAVVINNMRKALPQSGLRQADIYYEVLAEGDITRIISVFQDFDTEKIGPVRSTRHYFADFARDNDAILAHHGGSPQGYSTIRSQNMNNLDGMQLEGTAFFRDQARFNTPGMYEHSSYTGSERLLNAIQTKSYRSELYEDEKIGFSFLAVPAKYAGGSPAQKVTVPFSNNYQSVFVYDRENQVYNKFQGEEKHIDEETGEQLSVANILIQKTTLYVISGDDAGRREVKLVGEGDGLLISHGVHVPVRWNKTSRETPTRWYMESGDEIRLNKGKTWICVFQDNGEVVIE